ncbi:FkbM family methyltransferase [Microbispora sp. NPDC049125]|uniref:FkbM family methyltransferase n=1 Tax=Microbispora sp. NPDC049125 TaxID=3154929 RepID=UPI0034664500
MSTALSFQDCDGYTWALRPGSADRIGPGPHEHDLWRLTRSFAEPGAAFLDVGAHVGHYTLRMADAFTKVIAIEPNQNAVQALRLNLRLNDIDNVEVHPVAAHDCRAEVRLWDPFNVTAGACTRTLAAAERPRPPADCEIATLYSGEDGYGAFLGHADALPIDLIAGRSEARVAFIKVDVEGHEGRVLAGAVETINRHQPAILIEMHDPMYGKHIRDEVVEQLARHDYAWCDFSLYQRSKMTQSDMCPYIYAEPVAMGRVQEFLNFAEQANDGAASRWLTVP